MDSNKASSLAAISNPETDYGQNSFQAPAILMRQRPYKQSKKLHAAKLCIVVKTKTCLVHMPLSQSQIKNFIWLEPKSDTKSDQLPFFPINNSILFQMALILDTSYNSAIAFAGRFTKKNVWTNL